MFFRSRRESQESSVVKSPSIKHIEFVLQSVISALNDYINTSNYYLFSNKSKVTDPASSRGKDINSIANIAYQCVNSRDVAGSIVHHFFARLHLNKDDKIEFPQMSVPDSMEAEELIVRYIEAMRLIEGYEWSVGLTGKSELRDAVNEAVATHSEDEYIQLLSEALKTNAKKSRHEQNFIHLAHKYDRFFRHDTCSLKEKAAPQEPNSVKALYHEVDHVGKSELINGAVSMLFYCVGGDDQKKKINEKSLLKRALQSRDLDKKELVISFDRKKYGVLIGDNADQLVGEIPAKNKDVKYYLFKFNLKEPRFWQYKADIKYNNIYKHLVSYHVVFMKDKEKVSKQTNLVHYHLAGKHFDVMHLAPREYQGDNKKKTLGMS